MIYKRLPKQEGDIAKFVAIPGRFVPSFGREHRDAREVYKDIANCYGCKGGMCGQFLCRMHKTQTEKE